MSDPKPEEVKVEETKPEGEVAAGEGKKGQFSARGGRGGRGGGARNQGVKYVKKGEKETEEEEHKGGEEKPKEPREKKPWKGERRGNKEDRQKEKEKITLETVIPEKPKKHEILKEPSEEEFHKQLNDIDDKIEAVYDRLRKYSKEMRDTQSKNKGNKETLPLKDLLTVKLSERARLNDEIKTLSVQNNEKKAIIEDLYNKSTKYRQKLRKYFKKDEIESALKDLIDTQKKGNITLAEEKIIIKEIAELEKALPFAGPLEIVEKELEEVKADRKKVTQQLNVLFTQRELIQKEIDELKTDIDNRKKEKEEVLKKLDPIIESKKEDYKNEIDDLKNQKQKIKDKYHLDRDAYYKQQQLIQDIEWKTKIKNRLIREEQRKKREEEEKLLEEEEKKEEQKFNPHQEDINLCELLIGYVQNLIPKGAAVKTEEVKQETNQQVQEDWKKQKLSVIQSKKESDGDFFSAKGKKNKNVKKEKKEEPVNEKQALQHQFEVLGYFEKLKVPPPLFVNKLEETVKLLKEKRDYYNGLPLEAPKKGGEVEEKTEEKKPEPKKAHEKAHKHGIEVNETDFPSI